MKIHKIHKDVVVLERNEAEAPQKIAENILKETSETQKRGKIKTSKKEA